MKKQATKPKTPQQARAEFERKGLSIAGWARDNGFGRSLVYEVLHGRKKCHRGDSHKIAVLLGMKDGEIVQ
jgi:gp16 family phage-associated protein